MKRNLVLLAVLLFAAAGAFPQTTGHIINITLTPAALIDMDSTADMALGLALSGLAGDPPSDTDTATRYLWYTVFTNDAPGDTVIQASVAPALPAEMTLTLTATDMGGGAGDRGTAGTIAAVTAVDQPLVTDIGTCYTGRAGVGTRVVYDLAMSGYTGANVSTTITYTISGY